VYYFWLGAEAEKARMMPKQLRATITPYFTAMKPTLAEHYGHDD
jgi:hypothetical protein